MQQDLPSALLSPNSIEGWLDMFTRLLKLPVRDKHEIMQELECHLRERVRDLMIAGESESSAIRSAVSELGETAELADRFCQANRYPKRRRRMYAITTTLAVGMIGLGTWALIPNPTQVPYSVYQSSPQSVETIAALDDRIDVTFDAVPLREVTDELALVLGQDVLVHWIDLEDYGIRPETTVTLQLRDTRAGRVLDLLLEQIDKERFGAITWSFSERPIELGSHERFDRRTIELISYDIGPMIRSLMTFDDDAEEAGERIVGALLEMVEPNYWREHGGDMASQSLVGGQLFVQAPQRMHEQIVWMLDQITAGGPPAPQPPPEPHRPGAPPAPLAPPAPPAIGGGGGFGAPGGFGTPEGDVPAGGAGRAGMHGRDAIGHDGVPATPGSRDRADGADGVSGGGGIGGASGNAGADGASGGTGGRGGTGAGGSAGD